MTSVPPHSAPDEDLRPLADESARARICAGQFEAARLSFDQRRSYQLKMGLSLWAALLTMIIAVAKGEIASLETVEQFVVSLVTVLVLVGHGYFLLYSQRAGKVDQRKAESYEEMLNGFMGMRAMGWKPVTNAIDATRKGRGTGRWIEILHWLITLLLVVTLLALVWF